MKKLILLGDNYLHLLEDLQDERTKKINESKEFIQANNWFFDGELETMLKYDKGVILNYGDFNLIVKRCWFNGNNRFFKVVSIPTGVYEVEVVGINEPCIGYFYVEDLTIPELLGYVVLKRDTEAVNRAKEAFIKRQWIL